METIRFNPQELSSRKLWQLVNPGTDRQINEQELTEAVAELARRRHYLEQLQEIGALDFKRKD